MCEKCPLPLTKYAVGLDYQTIKDIWFSRGSLLLQIPAGKMPALPGRSDVIHHLLPWEQSDLAYS